jgi:hypothetical protein
LRRALIALLSAGCTVSGTGVMLHVEAPGLMPTSLQVVASYDGANVSRTVPLGGAMLPASFLAELPDHDLMVTFDVTATPSGHGTTMAIAVPAHHIVDATVTLSGGSGDGGTDGGASDGGPADMGFFTGVHSGGTGRITSIWGTSTGELYATCSGCGGQNLLLFTSMTGWVAVPNVGGGVDLNGVWGTDNGSDVWLVGAQGTVLHGSAGTFTAQSSPATSTMTINAIWGVGTEMFAVGSSNLILHFTGGGWISENITGGNDLYGVWGTSATDVYVVGSGGTIFHKTSAAASWPAETSHTSATLYSVGGSSGDIYAVGSGVIARSSGSGNWTASTQAFNFARVQAATSTDVWIAGAGGLVERGLGTSFNMIPTGTSNALDALWVLQSGEAFVGGDQQTILHHL